MLNSLHGATVAATRRRATRGGLGSLAGFASIPTLTPNSNREAIKQMQRALNYWMDAGLTVDGAWGDYTQYAVQQFQQSIYGTFSNDRALDENGQAALGLIPGGRFPLPGATTPAGDSGSVTPSGGGGSTAPSGSRVNFEWKCPATLQVTALSTWSTAQSALTAAAISAGYDIQYASWETHVFSGATYSLVYRGLSPSGVTSPDSINNQLLSMAEHAGFSPVASGAAVTIGQLVTSGVPVGNAPADSGKPFNINDWLKNPLPFFGGAVTGGVAVAVLVGIWAIKGRR